MVKKNFSDEEWNLFTDELKGVLTYINDVLSYEHPTLTINENYFLLAIFQDKECLAYKIIDALLSSTAFNIIHDAYKNLVKKTELTIIKPNRVILFDETFKNLIKDSFVEMKNIGDERLSSIHVILSLINPDKNYLNIQKIMKSAGLGYNLLITKINSLKENINDKLNNEGDVIDSEKILQNNKQNVKNKKYNFELVDEGKVISSHYLNTYCHNLNKKAKDGLVDIVIGREEEIDRIAKIFNRRKKNNPVLVGDKGSGKTCICEYLAWLIVNNNAPYSLRNNIILKLDIPSIIAGTTYRGMFEERIRGVFEELKKNKDCILFIDDIHNYSSKNDSESNTDITPFVKEYIDAYNIKVLTTCTKKGYHKKFDKDQSFANKFQRIDISTLDDEKIKNILMDIKGVYEDFHSIKINENIIDISIDLCKKYVTDREMPDSIIDLIDELGASVSNKYKETEEVVKLKKELFELGVNKKELIKSENFDEIDGIIEKQEQIKKQIKKIEKKSNYEIVEITDNHVFDILSKKTGVPIQNLSNEIKKDLSTLNERLKKIIIGQDEGIDTVCKTIKRKKLGLHNGRSTAILIQGKSGCGKTLLAKKLAEELFGSENALVRFDMSEYSDKTAVNKLIGSNAGYVGYEEGGLLTETIKNKKHCILLLDEIEKADKEIFNLFLQVFDEGFLTDNTGQKVDFKNVIIILTSNVGVKAASENKKIIGFNNSETDENKKSEEILKKELKKTFAPEFINRLDSIIYFNTLTKENLKEIVKIELNKSVKRFKDIGYEVTYSDNVIDIIMENIKEEEEDYGARPIIRTIQNEFEDIITDTILDGFESNKIETFVDEDKIKIKKV